MAVLTDFFIATEQEIVAIDGDDSPAKRLPGLMRSGLLIDLLAELYALVTHQQFSSQLIDTFALVWEGSAEGPWIYRFPWPFVQALAATDLHTRLHPLAHASWPQLAQFNESDRDGLTDALEQLAHLARQAIAEQKALYTWICL